VAISGSMKNEGIGRRKKNKIKKRKQREKSPVLPLPVFKRLHYHD